jgi:hypothetical protein
MSRSNLEKWARLQRLGRSHFVLRYGVLGFGLLTATLFVLLQGYLHGVTAALFQLVPAFILFPLGGYAWGRFMWWFLEKYHGRTVTTDAL